MLIRVPVTKIIVTGAASGVGRGVATRSLRLVLRRHGDVQKESELVVHWTLSIEQRGGRL
jgi:NAD(P)-dependent dehydrogenase (short-subunit alcohol dehydrogenase family)